MDFFDLLQNHAAAFLLVLTRISGIFIVAPFLGSQNIPQYFRVGIAFAMTLVIYPVVMQRINFVAPPTVLAYTFSVLSELFVGWLIGFVAYICLMAVNMAGKIMDLQAGFAVVNEMDPTSGQQNPLIGSFLYYLTLIVFVLANGHHVLITALVNSIDVIPITGVQLNTSLATIMVDFTANIFLTGMKIAMPLTFAILLTNVSLGVLARTMPQMNIFVVGIPMQIVVGLFTLAIVVPFYIMFLDVLFNEMYGNIAIALRALQ